MRAHDELVERCARERNRQLGGLSANAYVELYRDVHENVGQFVQTDDQRAYQRLGQALSRYYDSRRDDDLRSDEEFSAERKRRMTALARACQDALSLDASCLDAQLMLLLTQDLDPSALLNALLRLEHGEQQARGDIQVPRPDEPWTQGAAADDGTADAWADVYQRPRLRLRAAIVRTCLDTVHYRTALHVGNETLAASPGDAVGIRQSLALAYARLEDEDGFNALEAATGHRGDAWFHLARVLLLYKLDRMPAATRALHGYDSLVTGGAYALLRPVYIDTYMPDRPSYPANSFDEAMLAVHEADPEISDTPDFITWCEGQDWLVASARSFCDQNGLDWE